MRKWSGRCSNRRKKGEKERKIYSQTDAKGVGCAPLKKIRGY